MQINLKSPGVNSATAVPKEETRRCSPELFARLEQRAVVAAPKAQAKEPIQVDIILVCRKARSAAGLV